MKQFYANAGMSRGTKKKEKKQKSTQQREALLQLKLTNLLTSYTAPSVQ